jgi:preprotein translocase subunit SecA
MGLFSKMFGGNKSEKDVRAILPLVTKINQHFDSFQSISNDELRSKTLDFRQRIKDALKNIDAQIADTNKRAEEISFNDLLGKDTVYQEVDKLKKDRDQKIEDVLKEILPEAFAVVKETARRFKDSTEI